MNYSGKSTLVAELSIGSVDLRMKLNSTVAGLPADRIPLKDAPATASRFLFMAAVVRTLWEKRS